jgi:uncharacterized BrkB/YihY/UPF0761 family membrane protein
VTPYLLMVILVPLPSRSSSVNESKQTNTVKYSLLQIILIVIVLTVAVIVFLYFLTREEPKETSSFWSDKIVAREVV